MTGTFLLDKVGRKSLAAYSTGLLIVFILIIGGLTAGKYMLPIKYHS
jgi:hypothetical protein